MNRPRGSVVTEVSQLEDPALYMRLYRARSPEKYERERKYNRAAGRARVRVARLHEDEFDALLKEELRREGIQ